MEWERRSFIFQPSFNIFHLCWFAVPNLDSRPPLFDGNPSTYLCHLQPLRESIVFTWPEQAAARLGPEEENLENVRCLRCNRELESGRKFVAIYMFAQTVGIKPRQKSSAQRIVFCPQCSVSLALGMSPEGALNVAAWDMIRDLVSADPGLNQAAWENLRGVVGLLEASDSDPEPQPRSDAWVNFSRAV
jgi:hypothetical protein